MILYALIATLGTWALTALGAAVVVFFRSPNKKLLDLMMGFAAGVMIAASFWSLLAPAIEQAKKSSRLPPYLVALGGFLAGAVFMWASDKIVTRAQNAFGAISADSRKSSSRMIMLVLSITMHNIPEGLAVGVAFGVAATADVPSEALMSAVAISLGIGLQNFPEGAAVSLPLRREGSSRKKSFLFGQLSGSVEPVAAVIGAALAVYAEAFLPYALSFAAGAMILVAVHELIPECQKDQSDQPYLATMGIIFGFGTMMLLDVMLG